MCLTRNFPKWSRTELEKNGVHIHLGERVMSFEGEDDKVTAVKTDKGLPMRPTL